MQRWVTAQQDECEALVADRVELVVVGRPRGHGGHERCLATSDGLGPEPIDDQARCGGVQPCGRVVRHSGADHLEPKGSDGDGTGLHLVASRSEERACSARDVRSYVRPVDIDSGGDVGDREHGTAPLHEPGGEARMPSPCDLVIDGGWILDVHADAGPANEARSIAVVGARIADVAAPETIAARWRPERRIDASGSVVCPGFVDAHVHLGAFLGAMRPYERPTAPSPYGGSGDPQAALRTVARFCAMPVPGTVVATLVRPALAAMLRSGYTGVVDAGGPGTDGAWEAACDVGIRAAIGPSLADRWHDESGVLATRADADEQLAGAEAFLDARAGRSPTVVPLVSAVETLGCSDGLLSGIASLAERFSAPVHVHSHIGREDHDASIEAYGAGPTARLEACGLLSPRTTIMHAGELTDADVAAFATSGVTVNHNPVGNGLYGFGVAAGRAVPRLLAAGVPVVLGSDWTPAVTCPFELIRSALILHRDAAADDLALSLEDAITMATTSDVVLGHPGELGRLAPGHLADIVIIDRSGSHHLASNHPVPAVALHARSGDVGTVIVNGRIVVDGGTLVTADERQLIAEAKQLMQSMR